MLEPEFVAVEATAKRYRALRHEPSGATFDEHGHGVWPADQFTFRLRAEGALRIVEAAPDEKPGVDPKPTTTKTTKG